MASWIGPFIALVVAAPDPGAVKPPVEAPAGPEAATPIDCPLHGAGAAATGLKPFAESEKYIEHLDRPDRAAWQRPEEVIRALHLSGSEVVVDVGAGSGYFTFRLARALPRGQVVAVDVDPEMVRHVHHKVMVDGIANVKAVLATPTDPSVDARADLVFVCDVLHHVQGREAWVRKLFAEMRPGARLVIIEFKDGPLPVGPPEAMRLPVAKVTALLRGAGFTARSEEPGLLPYQTFLVFEKPRG